MWEIRYFSLKKKLFFLLLKLQNIFEAAEMMNWQTSGLKPIFVRQYQNIILQIWEPQKQGCFRQWQKARLLIQNILPTDLRTVPQIANTQQHKSRVSTLFFIS